jgi:glycine/D-amino acid oxidase-like deaminating enzyme
MRYDYLIVGQGLAGSALAIQLLKRRRKFLLIDQPSENTSSVVAAGLYNPITGRNWVKTWMADKIFPYMQSYYREVEEMTHLKFLLDKTIYRPFSTLDEQNDWFGRSEDQIYSDFIHGVSAIPLDDKVINNPIGGLEIKQGGNLLIPRYLHAVRQLLKENGCYKEEHFDFNEVKVDDDKCVSGGHNFGRIIFCQGPQSADSELWKFLPFNLVKGEILTVNVKMKLSKIYNKSSFILPIDDSTVRIGSTYDRSRLDNIPTEKAKMQLVGKMEGFFKPAFEVTDQKAGVRPATIDRKPFLGMHPNDKKLIIFNGLGAKGVTLGPFFANHLLNHLENDTNLLKEVEINRIIK